MFKVLVWKWRSHGRILVANFSLFYVVLMSICATYSHTALLVLHSLHSLLFSKMLEVIKETGSERWAPPDNLGSVMASKGALMHHCCDLFPICSPCNTNAINERQRQGRVRWPKHVASSTLYQAVEVPSIDWRPPCPLFSKLLKQKSSDDLYLVATFTTAIGKCKKRWWWWLPHRLSKQWCPVAPSPPFQPAMKIHQ